MSLVAPMERVADNFKMVFNVQRQLALRRRQRSFGSVARRAAAVAGAGWRIGSKLRSALAGSSAKRNETGFVTNQYDVKTLYRKKRMPRFRKRRWLKFKRRVLSATNAQGAKQCLVFRRVLAPTVSVNAQSVISAMLYGYSRSTVATSGTDVGCKDLQDIWDAWENTAAAGDSGVPGKINFTSAVLDIELGNVGGDGYANSLTVDVYHVRCKKRPIEDSVDFMRGFAELFDAGLNAGNMPNMSSNNTIQLDDAQSGITPFCNPKFCRYVDILSVKKVLLSVGQNTHFQLRLSKDKVYSHTYTEASDTALYPGWTEGYLFIVQGVTALGQFSAPVQYVMNATRTYHFRVDEQHKMFGGLYATSS